MEKSDESRTRRDEQRRKYSKMDKRAKDKLVRSHRENGGGSKLRGFSPRANHTDKDKLVSTFLRIEGCHVVSATGPHGR